MEDDKVLEITEEVKKLINNFKRDMLEIEKRNNNDVIISLRFSGDISTTPKLSVPNPHCFVCRGTGTYVHPHNRDEEECTCRRQNTIAYIFEGTHAS